MEEGWEDGNQLVARISRSRIPSHQQCQCGLAANSYACVRDGERDRECACEGVNLDTHCMDAGMRGSLRGHARSETPSDPA